jgi:hypothetical protein
MGERNDTIRTRRMTGKALRKKGVMEIKMQKE